MGSWVGAVAIKGGLWGPSCCCCEFTYLQGPSHATKGMRPVWGD